MAKLIKRTTVTETYDVDDDEDLDDDDDDEPGEEPDEGAPPRRSRKR